MQSIKRRVWLGLLVLPMVVACATLPQDFTEPTVSLLAVKPRNAEDLSPEFDVVLRITNPNRKALEINGLTYRIRLDGSEVIDGVASELPAIAPYGEAEVTVRARANLLGGINFLAGLLANASRPVDFELVARIDVGAFYPVVQIERRGQLTLR